MLGDNPDESLDFQYWYNPINHEDDILAKQNENILYWTFQFYLY